MNAFAQYLFKMGGIRGLAKAGHLKEYKLFRKGRLEFRTATKERRMKTQASWFKEQPSKGIKSKNKNDCWFVGQIRKIVAVDIQDVLPETHLLQSHQVLVDCRWFQLKRTDPSGIYETGPELLRYEHSFGCVESIEPIRVLANDHGRDDGRYDIVFFDSGLPACMETMTHQREL